MSKVIAIIGGGPAGLMAAEAAVERGAHVDVYDAMPSVGRKFLLAGKGGLNLTHGEPLDPFLDRYGARRAPRAARAFPPRFRSGRVARVVARARHRDLRGIFRARIPGADEGRAAAASVARATARRGREIPPPPSLVGMGRERRAALRHSAR